MIWVSHCIIMHENIVSNWGIQAYSFHFWVRKSGIHENFDFGVRDPPHGTRTQSLESRIHTMELESTPWNRNPAIQFESLRQLQESGIVHHSGFLYVGRPFKPALRCWSRLDPSHLIRHPFSHWIEIVGMLKKLHLVCSQETTQSLKWILNLNAVLDISWYKFTHQISSSLCWVGSSSGWTGMTWVIVWRWVSLQS